MSNHENPGGAASGPTRQHRREAALGVEVGEQAAEVALVGAVAVQQQQEALGVAAVTTLVTRSISGSPSRSAAVQNM